MLAIWTLRAEARACLLVLFFAFHGGLDTTASAATLLGAMAGPATNILYYGDNLDILRRYIDDESVDLIYLDPPFNSNADYNVLFAEKDGTQAHAQITAFEDTWTWDIEA